MFKRKPKHTHTWLPISHLRKYEDQTPSNLLSRYTWTTWIERYCSECGATGEVRVSWYDWESDQLAIYLKEVYGVDYELVPRKSAR